MSRSTNQHDDDGWNAPNRFLKKSTKIRRRAAEREFLHRIKEDPEYCEENVCPAAKDLEDLWNWD